MVQPSTELQVPYVRDFASVLNDTIGNIPAAVKITANALGGFFTQPINVPVDYDRTRPGRLFVTIASGTSTQPAGDIVLLASWGWFAAPDQVVEGFVQPVIAIPADWDLNDSLIVEVGSEASPFFPGGTFPPNASFGLRIARNGGLGTDTWTGSLKLMQSLRLRYSRLCQFCDGC